MIRECGQLQHGKRFPLRLKRAIYKSYGSEVWFPERKQDGYFMKDRDPGENNVSTTDCDWTMAK